MAIVVIGGKIIGKVIISFLQEYRSFDSHSFIYCDETTQPSQCHADIMDQHNYGWPTCSKV